MRPLMGAVTCVYSRSSCADRIAAIAVSHGRCRCSLRHSLVIGAGGDEVVLAQGARRARVAPGRVQAALRSRAGPGPGRSDLEGPRLDDEEKIAGLDELAVREVNGFDVAADPRTHLDQFQRLELAGEVAPLLHHLDQRLGHGDVRVAAAPSLRSARPAKSPNSDSRARRAQ